MEVKVDRQTIIEIAKANDLPPHIVEKGIRLFDVLGQMVELLDGRVILDGGSALNYGRARSIKPRLTRDLDLIYDGDIVDDLSYVVSRLSKLEGYILCDDPIRGDWAYNFYLKYRNIDYRPDTIWFEFYHSRPPAVKVAPVTVEFPLLDLGQLGCRAVSLVDMLAIKLDALSKHTRWQDIYDLNNVLPRLNNMNDVLKALDNYGITDDMWRKVWSHLRDMRGKIHEGVEFMHTWVPKHNRVDPKTMLNKVDFRLRMLNIRSGLLKFIQECGKMFIKK